MDQDQKPPRSLNSDSEVALDLAEREDTEKDELDDFEDEEAEVDGFRIRDRIERPEAKVYTTRELHSLIHEGSIDLSPDYQREVVWPEIKQIHLIDSIFRNFYIPPIIFAVQVDDGEEVRVCVDGKQRLTSIQKFFDGQIPYRDYATKKSYWFTMSDSSKKSRLDVPKYWKEWFSSQPITCVEYKNITPGTERDIFQRVQMGIPLVAAEKLQAIDSAWAQWISSLEGKHIHSDDGLSTFLDWASDRGRAFQCIAHLVYLCDGLPQRLLPTAQKITKWITRVDSPPEGFKRDIDKAIKEFLIIAGDKEYSKGFTKVTKRVAPVEFAFIGVLMYVMRDNNIYSRRKRAEAIYDMRQYVRGYFSDVRNRTDVGQRLWHFVQSIENPGSVSLDEVLEGTQKKIRKRKAGDVEDDKEYRPEAVRNLGSPVKTRSTKKKI